MDSNFKKDLVKWLLETEHHEVYKNKLEEFKRTIDDRDKQITKLEELNKELNLKVKQTEEINKIVVANGEAIKRKRVEYSSVFNENNYEESKGTCSIF